MVQKGPIFSGATRRETHQQISPHIFNMDRQPGFAAWAHENKHGLVLPQSLMMLARSPCLMLRDKLCCWLKLSRFDGEKLGRLGLCSSLSACLCAQPSVWPQRRDVSRSPILPTPVSTSCWRWVGVCVCEEFSRETRFHTPKAERGAVQLCFKSCCCC